MTPEQQNADLLAVQECESLGACIGRGQEPESYQDIIMKIRGHADKLPADRKAYWIDQCKALGVELYPPPPPEPKKGKSSKPEASSTP